jgi:hypothetical protein
MHDSPCTARPESDVRMTEISDRLLRIVFDTAVHSMDFGSGFLDDEEVAALREVAVVLGVDPAAATPRNFTCKYRGHHAAEPHLDTPFFDGPDGLARNAFRRVADYPEDVRGKLRKPGGGAYDLGMLRAPVIYMYCRDCGKRWDAFDDTSVRGGDPATAAP